MGDGPSCLVTGANGFLGCNLVRALLERGWHVTASVRRKSNTRYLDSLPIRRVEAELSDRAQVEALFQRSCEAPYDVVFHAAGDTSYWRRRWAQQRASNVDATLHLARAVAQGGAGRLVYTSTLDVLGHSIAGRLITEETGSFTYAGQGYHYAETKFEATEALKRMAAVGSLDLVTLYPGFLVGPYDHTLQLGAVFFELQAGRVLAFPPGGGSFAHVAAVAQAHVDAAERAASGEGFILAGGAESNLTHRELWRRIAVALGARPPRFTAPRAAVVAYAAALETVSMVTGRAPQLDRGQARYLASEQYADSSKAVEQLGYRMPPVDVAIADALTWYRSEGFLPSEAGSIEAA